MLNKIRNNLAFIKNNFQDLSVKRKLVVFESDDWGSIRMPSREVYELLIKKGYPVDIRPFERFDSIATSQDLDCLFNLLSKHKDKNGRHPQITANTIAANPDFGKIRKSDFKNYFFEPFTTTINNYTNISFEKWKEGIDAQLIFPQLHGREHLNVFSWMDCLLNENSAERVAFNYGLMGIPTKENPELGNVHQVAFDVDFEDKGIHSFYHQSIREAQTIFKETFGFESKTFIAPVYTWNDDIEKILKNVSVDYMQGGRYQVLPLNKGKRKHFSGQESVTTNMRYLIRNAYFEPSTYIEYNKRLDVLNGLKKQTETVFNFNKPLVVSVHRLNFVGRIFEENRDVNLKLFNEYLKWLITSYPDVEFVNSVELAQNIYNEISHT